MNTAREVGSRPATRVRIRHPFHSRYNGRVGIVADIHEASGTVFVRFSPDLPALPFARSACVVLPGTGPK